jgi:hypothetical protein
MKVELLDTLRNPIHNERLIVNIWRYDAQNEEEIIDSTYNIGIVRTVQSTILPTVPTVHIVLQYLTS